MNQKQIKAGVISLGKEIETKYGVKVSRQWLLEQTAKHLAGVSHWGVLKEALPVEPVAVEQALELDVGNDEHTDYLLRDDHDSCWIRVDTIDQDFVSAGRGEVVP